MTREQERYLGTCSLWNSLETCITIDMFLGEDGEHRTVCRTAACGGQRNVTTDVRRENTMENTWMFLSKD